MWAAAYSAVYAAYVVDFHMTPEQVQRHVESTAIDPARSPLWLDDTGAIQAMAALGIREQRGWIGGFGVAPAYRGQHLSHALLRAVFEIATSSGLRQLELEVLANNLAAIHVYERGGFRRAGRDLVGLRGDAAHAVTTSGSDADVHPVSLEQALAALAALRPAAPCWQREGGTLLTLPGMHGLRVGEALQPAAAVAYRVAEAGVIIADIAARDPKAATTLIAGLAREWPGRPIHLSNEPEGSAGCQAALRAGCIEVWRQHRMVCPVDENSL
jgi:ribosomal protein S18 acetylase RimI-like enzyme